MSGLQARSVVLPDTARDAGEAWHCDWVDPTTGAQCPNGGTLRQRKGISFLRHDCYGHEPDTPRRFRRTYYVCFHHYRVFSDAHSGRHHHGGFVETRDALAATAGLSP